MDSRNCVLKRLREQASICLFTPQVAAVPRDGPSRSQGTCSSFWVSASVAGDQALGLSSTDFPDTSAGSSKVELLILELMLRWDSGIADGGLTHYSIIPVPNCYL